MEVGQGSSSRPPLTLVQRSTQSIIGRDTVEDLIVALQGIAENAAVASHRAREAQQAAIGELTEAIRIAAGTEVRAALGLLHLLDALGNHGADNDERSGDLTEQAMDQDHEAATVVFVPIEAPLAQEFARAASGQDLAGAMNDLVRLFLQRQHLADLEKEFGEETGTLTGADVAWASGLSWPT